jgi:hypothetical protein
MARFKVDEAFLWAEEAGEDLTSSLNLFMKMATGASNEPVIKKTVAGEKVFGTLFEVPLSASAPYGPATVQFGGVAKVKSGAAVTCGSRVQSDASAKAVNLTTGLSAGIALVGCSAADVLISVALIP